MRLLKRLNRILFGYDFFLSYSRSDCTEYTANLAKEIMATGYSCYIDQWGSDPGRELPRKLKNKIKNSSIFVLIASEDAAKSKAITEEIDLFLPTKRIIIPVDFGNIKSAIWYRKIEGIAHSIESVNSIKSNTPSREIIERCVHAFIYVKQSKRIRNSLVVALLLVTAIIFSSKIMMDNKDKMELEKDKMEIAEFWTKAEADNSVESYISFLINIKVQTDSIHIKEAISNLKLNKFEGLEGYLHCGLIVKKNHYTSKILDVFWRARTTVNLDHAKPEIGDVVQLRSNARNRTTYKRKGFLGIDRNNEPWRPNTKAFVTEVHRDGNDIIIKIVYY